MSRMFKTCLWAGVLCVGTFPAPAGAAETDGPALISPGPEIPKTQSAFREVPAEPAPDSAKPRPLPNIEEKARPMPKVAEKAKPLPKVAEKPKPATGAKKSQPKTAGAAALLQRAYEATKTAETERDYSEIIRLCQQCLEGKLQPAAGDYARRLLSWAHNRRGEIFAAAGRDEDSLAEFEASVQYDRTRWRAVHNRGVSLAQLGKYDQAIADFDRTIRLNPKFVNAYFNRAELLYEQRDYTAAIEDYSQVLRLDPKDAAAYNSRGHAFYRRGEFRSALADYTKAIEIDPANAAAYTNRGDVYADMTYYSQAARDYRAAIRIDPNLGRAYQSAAWLMATCPDQRFRNAQLAVDSAKKAVALDGDGDYRYLDTLSAAYANAGNFDLARETQAAVVEKAPKDDAARYRKRLALYQQGKPYRDGAPLAAQVTASREKKRR
ncbi:MAG: tetratricopeptide repeat protein [Pirellulales bacterium]